jgi:hypothetical protein
MPYVHDRTEAANILAVSTRTVDRHISSGRLGSKRIWKKIYIEEDDILSLKNELQTDPTSTYTIVPTDEHVPDTWEDISVSRDGGETIIRPKKKKTQHISAPEQTVNYQDLYTTAVDTIARKDATITELSYRLWKAETELWNSISLLEYKKATFLLESSNTVRDENKIALTQTISTLEGEVSKRNSMILALVIMFVTVIISATLYFEYMNGSI